jgi:hypothetical protein
MSPARLPLLNLLCLLSLAHAAAAAVFNAPACLQDFNRTLLFDIKLLSVRKAPR